MIIPCCQISPEAHQDLSLLMVLNLFIFKIYQIKLYIYFFKLCYCIDPFERAELESQAKLDYDQRLEALRLRGDLSEAALRHFERSVIIEKSVKHCKERATYQGNVRRSPERYDHIKSKVARCLQVQKSVSRRTRK